jgi:hypothetical protein
VAGPLFHLACTAGVLGEAPAGWVNAILQEGEIALLVDDGGLDAITALAHALDLVTVPLLRTEDEPSRQDSTVMSFAESKPLVWIAGGFGEAATRWAHQRGPMTLLVETDGRLSEDERRRIERFVVILGRQAE